MSLLVAAVVATRFDVGLSTWWASKPLPRELRTLLRFGETFGHFYGAAAIVLSVAIVCRSARLGLRLGWVVAAGGLAANVVKLLVGRQRPYALTESFQDSALPGFISWLPAWLQDSFEYGHAIQSFPSGHTATAAGLAFGLSRIWPHASPWFAFLACVVAVQRMESGAHFLSDVLAGGAVGLTAAYLASLSVRLRGAK
ncbi:MAG: phosphatase PAP2 family protein [Planctomycetales bacterium]|nr:phosphatase PAP2 family protein [Planctomycetales bacterium]